MYVAVDIGCIECGEPTTVLGVFTDKSKADEALGVTRQAQQENWHGQHSFEVFEVPALDEFIAPAYLVPA